MNVFNSFAELKAAEGTLIGESPWFSVNQDRINLFAEATGDKQWIHVDPHQWIHVDEKLAKEGIFGTTIAHGFLSLSLLPMLEAMSYEINNSKMKINYGLNRLRFITPLKVGSEIRAITKLLSAELEGDTIKITKEATVISRVDKKPILVAETLTLLIM
jgi:acyl dehydratase